jgi:hypothetical protein
MSLKLTDTQRHELQRIVNAGETGRKTHKYLRAKTLLAYEQGIDLRELERLMSLGLIESDSSTLEDDDESFEEDLDYILEKNSELYRRLAQ